MQRLAGSIDPKLAARLAIGLAQGLGLLALQRWQGHHQALGPVYFALVFSLAFLPPLLLAAWGAMGRKALAIWAGLALALLLGLGFYGSWRIEERDAGAFSGAYPDAASVIFAGLLIFIAHHLVQVATQRGRWRGPYIDYFDLTWKHGVQLGLSLLFTGVFWLVLWLGATMFKLISITALENLITTDWFAFPATSLAFAAAVHLTDARANLVIGARGLALTLLAWLLPLMAGIAAAFLLALPFTGLSGLWGTKFAGGLLMGAAVVLILLLNAAYQAGEKPANVFIAWVTRMGCFLLVPLCALAGYGLMLRIGQHGLTTSRVIAIAGLLVLSFYAIGYALAAFGRGAWLARLGLANVWCALAAAGVLLALLSPLADPSRLAVDSQIARLQRGAVLPEKFDYAFLDKQAGRWGEAALQKLVSAKGDARSLEIAASARAYQTEQPLPSRLSSVAARRKLVPDLTGPGAAPIPDGAFLKLQDGSDPIGNCTGQDPGCSMRQIDLDQDGKAEILLFTGFGDVLVLIPGGNPDSPRPDSPWSDSPWIEAARAVCCVAADAWKNGEWRSVPPPFANLQAGNDRLTFIPTGIIPSGK